MHYLYWLLGAVGVLSYAQIGFQMGRLKDHLKNGCDANSLLSLGLFPFGTYHKMVNWFVPDAFHGLAKAVTPIPPAITDVERIYKRRRSTYIALHVLGWPLSVAWSLAALSFIGPAMYFNGKLKTLLNTRRIQELPENPNVFLLMERRRLHLEEVEKIESDLRLIGGALEAEKHLDSQLTFAIDKEKEGK